MSAAPITFPRKKHSHRCLSCGHAVYCYKTQCAKPQRIEACPACRQRRDRAAGAPGPLPKPPSSVCPCCAADLGETILIPSGQVCPGCGSFQAP